MSSTRKPTRSAILSALRDASTDERKAVEFLEARRWGEAPACPRCGDTDVYQMRDRKTGERNRDYRWRCRGCKRMHTVRTGTVFEESRLPLRTWVHAYWRACASKKGVSALQISRECGIGYKAALFLMHRIRFAMAEPSPPKLTGTVEADETYVGGKPRIKGKGVREKWTDKTPVMGLVERGGRARLRVLERVTTKNLAAAVTEHADMAGRLITDENRGYVHVGRRFAKGHDTVNHRAGEYARGDVTTNTIEGVFAILKRGMYGTFHSVSKHHLHRYLAEFEFRYNTRGMADADRAALAIKAADGKRLTYRKGTERPAA
jgi:transposase-like protein